MTKLDQVRKLAERDATRLGRPLAILNLNPFSPLYVVREVPKATRPGELVAIIPPGRPDSLKQ
jgi:hypothetical protein